MRVQQEEPRRSWIQVNKDQQQFSPVLLLHPALLQFYNFTNSPQCTQDVSSWVSRPGSQAQQAPCAHLLCQGARAVCAQTCCTWCSGRIPWASNSIPSGDFQEQTKAQQVQKRNPKGFQNVKGKKGFKCWMLENWSHCCPLFLPANPNHPGTSTDLQTGFSLGVCSTANQK